MAGGGGGAVGRTKPQKAHDCHRKGVEQQTFFNTFVCTQNITASKNSLRPLSGEDLEFLKTNRLYAHFF